MHYRFASLYQRSLHHVGKERAGKSHVAVEKLIDFLEGRQGTPGLGLKHLGRGLWENRAGLKDRMIFCRSADTIEFLIAGSHDEIKRFLRHVRP